MHFVLNNKPITLTEIAPDTSLLRYLRDIQQLTGTKEGCASGDCGACTVLVGQTSDQGIAYRALNSCILALGSLHNHRIITVEGLSDSSALHPVQEAMVSCHASQCGFCTPGFVMSLAALHRGAGLNQKSPVRSQVIEAISGNLCRCTGYRPIIEAGVQALQKVASLPAVGVNKVQEWCPSAPLAGNPALHQADHGYWQPESEAQLQALLNLHPDAHLIAGGTDLMLEVSQSYQSLGKLIDLNRVASLTQVVMDTQQVILGAAVRYSDLEVELADISPEFVRLLSRLGSRQIRNRGTLGGNLCNGSPIADCPPWLLVLDAELLIGNSCGDYRREPLGHFYRDYKRTSLCTGEYLAQVIIQRAALSHPLKLFKISKRYEDDISAVMGAFRRDQQGQFYIAFGGMAAIPKRASATEAFLNQYSQHLNQEVIERACSLLAAEFSPLSDVRASAEYRLAMACNLLKKFCYADESASGVFSHA